jgi:hypothetical protein
MVCHGKGELEFGMVDEVDGREPWLIDSDYGDVIVVVEFAGHGELGFELHGWVYGG